LAALIKLRFRTKILRSDHHRFGLDVPRGLLWPSTRWGLNHRPVANPGPAIALTSRLQKLNAGQKLDSMP